MELTLNISAIVAIIGVLTVAGGFLFRHACSGTARARYNIPE
jgi:hypothetical protein